MNRSSHRSVTCGLAACAAGLFLVAAPTVAVAEDDVLEELRRLRERVEELESWKADRQARDTQGDDAVGAAVKEWMDAHAGEVAPLHSVWAPRSLRLELGGQFRVRGELQRRSYGPADVDGNDSNDILLARTRIHVKAQVHDDLDVFVELQDARTWGTEPGTASNTGNVDLSQGYADFKGLAKGRARVRLGRQAVSLSDQRFVGALEWSNNGRRLDGVTAFYEDEKFTGVGFAYRVAEGFIEPAGTFGPTVEGGDTDTNVYGTWWVFPGVVEDTTAELFMVYIDAGNPVRGEPIGIVPGAFENTNFGTYGSRVSGRCDDCGVDWDFQGAIQRGEIAGDSLEAWAWRGELGYRFAPDGWKPHLSVEYDEASGNESTGDGETEQFQVLLPTNHGYYGIHDYAAWSNLEAWAVHFAVQPTDKLKVRLSYWDLQLEEAAGGWVLASGGVLRPGADSGIGENLGREVDLVVTYQATERLTWEFGWAHFMPGEFVRDTQGLEGTVPSTDFVYLQTLISF